MSSLFRSLNNFALKRENVIKEGLINALGENLQEIQYEIGQKGAEYLELCEATSSLCVTLEAIFLHGLKDSFLWQTINAIAGADVDRRPEPSFWSPVLIFLHKEVIEQINKLSQVTSEIGQCRAWIRLSLNESLCSSYLSNIRKSSSALNPYYKKYALLKDASMLQEAEKLMREIEACAQFNLPTNSSLLNVWPDMSLQMSALWTPALKSCPISSAIDVAGSMPAHSVAIPTPQPVATNEAFAESISNSPFSRPATFANSEAVQHPSVEQFLQKVDEMAIIDEEGDAVEAQEVGPGTEPPQTEDPKSQKKERKRKKSRQGDGNRAEAHIAAYLNGEATPLDSIPSTPGNSLTNLMQTSWSSDINNAEATSNRTLTPTDEWGHTRFLQRSVSMTSSVSSMRSPLTDRCSYNMLLRKHERNRELDWTEVWDKFLIQNSTASQGGATGVERTTNDENDELHPDSLLDSQNNSEFEMIEHSILEKFDIIELQQMVEHLCRLPRESGLDAQGFLCKSCQHPLGIGYSNLHVCGLSGNYFCANCMDMEQVLIPSRIIYNWDFRKYSVSKRAAAFLAEFRNQPFIDLMLLNPDIYQAAEAMAELQSLRIRLNFIRAYLFTCSPSSFEELQKQFFGREYLFEHIHQYSINDLGMIQRGTLYQQLHKAYKAGEAHILKCALCSVKGFICEICSSPRVLYPFHIDTTFRCEVCGAVFHAHCLNKQQPCPKCERKKKRQDSQAIERLITLSDAPETSQQCQDPAN